MQKWYLLQHKPNKQNIALDINKIKWLSIKSTFGILRIVSFGNKPAEVPRDLIFGLMNKYLKFKLSDTSGPDRIKKGADVKILKGPFSGFIGRIEDFDQKRRLNILLEFMGNHKNIKIDANDTDLIY